LAVRRLGEGPVVVEREGAGHRVVIRGDEHAVVVDLLPSADAADDVPRAGPRGRAVDLEGRVIAQLLVGVARDGQGPAAGDFELAIAANLPAGPVEGSGARESEELLETAMVPEGSSSRFTGPVVVAAMVVVPTTP
jgi:hypothetical protein